MAEESKVSMVSLNDVVELARIFSRENLGRLIAPGVVMDCDGRCGCIGGNCECRGGVWSRWDRSWVEIQAERQERINELRRQIELLEERR